jgi:hypothetical protein
MLVDAYEEFKTNVGDKNSPDKKLFDKFLRERKAFLDLPHQGGPGVKDAVISKVIVACLSYTVNGDARFGKAGSTAIKNFNDDLVYAKPFYELSQGFGGVGVFCILPVIVTNKVERLKQWHRKKIPKRIRIPIVLAAKLNMSTLLPPYDAMRIR